MTFTFVCEEHKEYGSLGWRIKSQPEFDPLGGMAVAHDCLEHFSDSPNPADEFMALGASMFIRDETFYAMKGKHYTNPGVHIASDMPEILRHVINEGYELPAAPHTKALETRVEGYIDTMFEEYLKNIEDDYDYDELKLTPELKRSIRSYLRIGYRSAVRRYQNRDGQAQYLFTEIEETADKYLKHSEPGSELRVSVNFKDLTCKVSFLESWEVSE